MDGSTLETLGTLTRRDSCSLPIAVSVLWREAVFDLSNIQSRTSSSVVAKTSPVRKSRTPFTGTTVLLRWPLSPSRTMYLGSSSLSLSAWPREPRLLLMTLSPERPHGCGGMRALSLSGSRTIPCVSFHRPSEQRRSASACSPLVEHVLTHSAQHQRQARQGGHQKDRAGKVQSASRAPVQALVERDTGDGGQCCRFNYRSESSCVQCMLW